MPRIAGARVAVLPRFAGDRVAVLPRRASRCCDGHAASPGSYPATRCADGESGLEIDEARWIAQRQATGFGQSKLRRLMRRTQSAVDAAAELMKFSTSPEITPKRRMAYGNLGASPHRVRHIDLRDQGRGDGAAPPAAKLARLGTRPLPPPPVWDRRSSSIDSVSTEVVGVSPRTEGTEGGLLPRRASPGGGAADKGVENFSPVNHPAAVRPRTRPIAPTPERASPPERLAHVAPSSFGRPPLRTTPRRSRCRRPGSARRPHRARHRRSR